MFLSKFSKKRGQRAVVPKKAIFSLIKLRDPWGNLGHIHVPWRQQVGKELSSQEVGLILGSILGICFGCWFFPILVLYTEAHTQQFKLFQLLFSAYPWAFHSCTFSKGIISLAIGKLKKTLGELKVVSR